uniref:L-ascorbate peroxidase cytosolic-like n=1 Tax=Rhizophora mucronata TaxID=61149 RepID=A0A2P2LNY9_RHIMU
MRENERECESYARRSMIGAQFFSLINPLSFLLAFAMAALYSSLTVG